MWTWANYIDGLCGRNQSTGRSIPHPEARKTVLSTSSSAYSTIVRKDVSRSTGRRVAGFATDSNAAGNLRHTLSLGDVRLLAGCIPADEQ